LKAASGKAYDAADNAGVILKPTAVQRLAKEVQDDLAEFGYMPELQPKVGAFLGRLNTMANDNVTLKGVDQLRKAAGLMGKSLEPSEREIARQIIKKIDKHLDDLDPRDILPGKGVDMRGGVSALKEARRLWGMQRKAEMIEEAVEKAANNAAAAHSGGNIDNALRQQFRSILNNPKKSRGLSRDERAAMELIVRGVKGERLLRTLAKLSPNGNGLMAILQMGGIGALGPQALVAPAVGIPAKMAAERLTPSRIDQLSRVVRAGGDAASTRAAPNAAQRLAQSQRDALARALGIGGLVASQEPN
jgi:hypothetical protein